MEIKTLRNVGDRLYKVDGDRISYYDVENVEVWAGSKAVIIKYALRKNSSAGYREEVYEEDLASNYRDTLAAAVAVFVNKLEVYQEAQG